MISVNRVKNVVFFLLSKNNRGYISPMEFDSFASLAQMDLFENLFYRFNKWIINRNKRFSNSEFADIPKNIQEQIDVFSTYTTTGNFTYSTPNNLWSYSGSDLYRAVGLSLKNAQNKAVDVEEVSKGTELNNMINSTINGPTTTYPIYTKIGESFRVFPKVPAGYSLELLFVRTPKQVKWTYSSVNGNPIFNGGASDLQNFELHESIFPLLVAKILSYSGISVKEEDIAQAAANESALTEQKQS